MREKIDLASVERGIEGQAWLGVSVVLSCFFVLLRARGFESYGIQCVSGPASHKSSHFQLWGR